MSKTIHFVVENNLVGLLVWWFGMLIGDGWPSNHGRRRYEKLRISLDCLDDSFNDLLLSSACFATR